MTVTYCTANDVVSLLRLVDESGVRLDPDGTTDPSQTEIESWINSAEDYIDAQTNRSWRVSTEREMLSYNRAWTGGWRTEYALTLLHKDIKTLDHSEGDFIKIWTGGEWKDLIDPANGYTEGRNKDYWVDYVNGMIILVTQRPMYGLHTIDVQYRYGETTVPGDIKLATAKYAALRVMESDFFKMAMPNGPGIDINRAEIISKWEKDIDGIVERRRNFEVVLVV